MSSEQLDIAARLAAAVIAGALIGLERTHRGRPAGFRTHALVCLTSAMLMLVTVYEQRWMTLVTVEAIRLDPTRMAQGIMTGIGFLGAGVIFKEGASVRGLTTAASIWVTAGLGVLLGVGMYYEAGLAIFAILVVLTILLRVERRLATEYYTHHRVRFDRARAMSEEELRELVLAHGFRIVELGYALTDGGTVFEYRMVIHGRDPRNIDRLARDLLARPEVVEFQLSPVGD